MTESPAGHPSRAEALSKARAHERKEKRKARARARKGPRRHRCIWGEERHEDGTVYMVCGVCERRLRKPTLEDTPEAARP